MYDFVKLFLKTILHFDVFESKKPKQQIWILLFTFQFPKTETTENLPFSH